MGTHPIFESDFDCLTECNENIRMAKPIDSIREYCVKYGLEKTAELLPTGESKSNVELEKIFRPTKEKKVNAMKGLGIVFKGNAQRDELRKRIRNMEECHELKIKKRPKVEKKEKKNDVEEEEEDQIPEGFLVLLDELALDRKDADVLYKNKDQWKFVKSDRKIFCTETGCKFETTIGTDSLTKHCISAHGWKIYPCSYDYCEFEAYSPRSYKFHISSHKRAKDGQGGSIEHVCDRGNCGKRFNRAKQLAIHLKIHDNISVKCHFCPWTGIQEKNRVLHFNNHFRIKPFECSQCDAKFYTTSQRMYHETQVHEKILRVLKCGSCDFSTVSDRTHRKHIKLCTKRKI